MCCALASQNVGSFDLWKDGGYGINEGIVSRGYDVSVELDKD